MGLPTEDELRKLPKRAQAAFAVRCVKRIPDVGNWYGIRHVDVQQLQRAVDFLMRFAQGEVPTVGTETLVYQTKQVASFTEQQQKADSPRVESNIYAANTAHVLYEFVINYANAVAEAARLDPYQTMEASLSAIRSYAIYSCDSDPIGAISIEISAVKEEAVRAISCDYELLRKAAVEYLWMDDTPVSFELFDTPAEVSARRPAEEAKEEFQVFISFKNLDENGVATPDSVLAREVFDCLSQNGFRVFFSLLSLEKQGTSAFKRAIDDALDQCRVLVVVGTSRKNLEAEWVRYEWDGFFQDILCRIKPTGRIFSYVNNMTESSLPRVLRQNQVFSHERNELGRLLTFIKRSLD